MTYSLAPFALVVIALAIIITIVARRLPQLTLLDVDSLPEVKEGKKKDEIIRKKAIKKIVETKESRREALAPFFARIHAWRERFWNYLRRLEKSIISESKKKKTAMSNKTDISLEEMRAIIRGGDYHLERGELEAAEQKYIEAIKLDAKNVDAYYGLGNVYLRNDHLAEAEETFKFLLRLQPNNCMAVDKLGELAERKGDTQKAIEYYSKCVLMDDAKASRYAKIAELMLSAGAPDTACEAARQAVDIEPQNPKYLDLFIESSIISGNKKLAEDGFQRLRMVNPENQKLSSFLDRIETMPN
ncbi:MAG TPA: tetratricopeptide repeat protein [Candidatus Magasanikbacteria bacterium]|nr:tetratricopeptide repeat protein [Candidatus Magasanikbacteria bacterium]